MGHHTRGWRAPKGDEEWKRRWKLCSSLGYLDCKALSLQKSLDLEKTHKLHTQKLGLNGYPAGYLRGVGEGLGLGYFGDYPKIAGSNLQCKRSRAGIREAFQVITPKYLK